MKAFIKQDAEVLFYPYQEKSTWGHGTRSFVFDASWYHAVGEIGYWKCNLYRYGGGDIDTGAKEIRVYGLHDIEPLDLVKSIEAQQTSKGYVTSPAQKYNYDLSAAQTGAKLLVLNRGCSTSLGQVTGDSKKDSGIIAWSPMPVRDKEMEVYLGHLPVTTGQPALEENENGNCEENTGKENVDQEGNGNGKAIHLHDASCESGCDDPEGFGEGSGKSRA